MVPRLTPKSAHLLFLITLIFGAFATFIPTQPAWAGTLTDAINAGGASVKLPPGNYNEAFTVVAGKTVDATGVITSGQVTVSGGTLKNLTVKGNTIRGSNENAAIHINASNSVVDGCTANNNSGTGISFTGRDGAWVENVTIQHCTANNNGIGGIGGAYFRNGKVLDVHANGNNTSNQDQGNEGGAGKFAISDGLYIDGYEVNDNNGEGVWLDYQNKNYIVKNVYTTRGNGKYYDLVSEINEGPGRFENCHCKIGLWETMHVVLQDCSGAVLEFRDLWTKPEANHRRGAYHLFDIKVQNSQFQGIVNSLNMNGTMRYAELQIVFNNDSGSPSQPPTSLPPNPTPILQPSSPEGSTVSNPATGFSTAVVDGTDKGIPFTLSGGQIYWNGVKDSATSGVKLLYLHNGVIFQQTVAGKWYAPLGSIGKWSEAFDPHPTGPVIPPPTTVPVVDEITDVTIHYKSGRVVVTH